MIKIHDNKNGLNIDYFENFYTKLEANNIFSKLEKEIIYNSKEESKIIIFGKSIEIPRQQVAYGDEGLFYSFSGLQVKTKPWTPLLVELKNKVEQQTNQTFNFVLINRYKDGSQYIGYHSDDEKELKDKPLIVGLSFGASRELLFKHKSEDIIKKINLKHGSMYVMNDPTNKNWKHSIPTRTNILEPRISLTFRNIIN